jgi:uncharacterized protein (DUF2141 family)
MTMHRAISGVAMVTGAFALAGALAVAQGAAQQQQQGQQQQGQAQGRGGQGGGRGQTRDIPPPPVGTSVIAGAVINEGSGTPVRRARVTLSGVELRGNRQTMTSDDGRFSFAGLPAGRYTMTASKAGYVDIAYGAKRAGRPGTPIQLIEGQKLDKAVIRLPKGGVVTGIVIDESGEPSPGTTVRTYRYVMRTGERTLQPAGTDTTDDRGMYRIYGLQPGEYLVSAVPRNQNLGDLRQTLQAELDAITQAIAASLGAPGAGGGGALGGGGRGGGGGGGGGGGRGGGRAGDIGQLLGGGRAGPLGDRLAQVQQQLQQTEQEQTVAYAPVYFPGTTMPSGASAVTLAVGDERVGVDFQLQLVQTAKIEGTVTSPTGTTPQGTQVSLVAIDQGTMPGIPGVGTNQTRVNPDGRFTFTGIAPGTYRLMARTPVRQQDPNATQPGQPTAPQPGGRGGFDPAQGRGRGGNGPGQIVDVLWAATDVNVAGQNLKDVALTLQPGMTVTGRVQFEGTTATVPADLTRVRVNLAPRGQQPFDMGGGSPPTQVDAAGRFTITGVVPGTYTLSANAPSGNAQGRAGGGGGGGGTATAGAARGATTQAPAANWRLKSAVAGGRDVLDFPLVIEPNHEVGGAILTFTDRTQEVSGMIQDPMGRPTADFTIIVFPSDKNYWVPLSRRIVSARPITDGRFTLQNLPPGDYRLTAVTDVEPGEWYNPDFLQQLMGASIPISLQAGEKKIQDIRVQGGM